MSQTVLLAYLGACLLLALTPGPNMSLIVANTTAHGLRAGLYTLAGSGTGLATLVTLAALGTGSMMRLMADWFDVVRWAGAIYLCWLGVLQLRRAWRGAGLLPARPGSSRNWAAQGLVVSLSNPKVLLFLGAFFPQFVDPSRPAGPQLTLLVVLFVVVIVAVDVAYTLVLARLRRGFTARHVRALDGAAGMLLLAGGAVLATMRRP
jgi:homoserine/homoserine lactone efflux protein